MFPFKSYLNNNVTKRIIILRYDDAFTAYVCIQIITVESFGSSFLYWRNRLPLLMYEIHLPDDVLEFKSKSLIIPIL